jgi:hypothetical protein
MKNKYFLLVSSLLFFTMLNCNTTEPPPPPDGEKTTLELKLEDVSCIEAWIKLTTTNLELPATLTLKQFNPNGDTISQILNLNTQDSLLYVDSLLPNKNYQYQVSSIEHQVSSNQLSVTTMDTTSHNFTWQTFELGGNAGSCTFYDVAIINENYIIAVGNVFLTDSIGQPDPQAYGVAIWNGQIWELRKLFYNTNIPVTPRGIYVISPTEIYLASGSIFKWDGSSSNVQLVYSRLNLPDPNATIEKLWGSSNSSIYGVGNVGSIVFYNGQSWQRIESGTDLPIRDIWGDFNSRTNKYEILAVAAEIDVNNGSKMLRIDGNSVTEESNDGLSWQIGGLWFKSCSKYYIAGAGIHYKHSLSDSVWNRYLPGIVTNYVGFGLGGSDINNVFATGSFLEIAHYNGVSWHNYLDEISSPNGAVGRVTVNENMMVAVGLEGSSALIVIGIRN